MSWCHTFAALALCTLISACAPAAVQHKPKSQPPAAPAIEVAALTGLMPAAGLRWLACMSPRSLASIGWLQKPLARLFQADRLQRFARETGLAPAAIRELTIASYRVRGAEEHALGWFARHDQNARQLADRFRARLTGKAIQTAIGPQINHLWGELGRVPLGFVSIGKHVVGYQRGGKRRAGPTRLGGLYALGELSQIPTVLKHPSLRLAGARSCSEGQLMTAVQWLLPGPFEGSLASGFHGLMGGADALSVDLRPTPRRSLELTLKLLGDFGGVDERGQAQLLLRQSWRDMVSSDLGHLLGAHRAPSQAIVEGTDEGLVLRVDLDGPALLDGLVAVSGADARQMMEQLSE